MKLRQQLQKKKSPELSPKNEKNYLTHTFSIHAFLHLISISFLFFLFAATKNVVNDCFINVFSLSTNRIEFNDDDKKTINI